MCCSVTRCHHHLPNLSRCYPVLQSYTVLLDGAVLGYISHTAAPRLVHKLRYMKCHGEVRCWRADIRVGGGWGWGGV